jgi:peptidylprolyl isomerase
MRLRSLLGILLILLFTSACEDNKKQSAEKTPPTSKPDSTQGSVTNNSEIKNSPEDTNATHSGYPKLTSENVVAFLSTYGKENPETAVALQTNHGIIEIELFNDAPLHRANFIFLVKQGYFNGSFFHRVVPNFIIQGGNSDNISTAKKRTQIGKDYLLPAELGNGRIHEYGSISGAKEYRENPDKRSAPFEFFIFLGPKSSTGHLDGNYTVFGRVTKGMDVVEKIANLPSDEGDWPLRNVYIEASILK